MNQLVNQSASAGEVARKVVWIFVPATQPVSLASPPKSQTQKAGVLVVTPPPLKLYFFAFPHTPTHSLTHSLTPF